MKFRETTLAGVYEVCPERLADERGFFARTWCQKEFQDHGLDSKLVQCNISFNLKKGTLRGMHFQAAPFEETKLVRCTRGAIYDVVLDLRSDSNTYRKWTAATLTEENRSMLCVPKGCAHGFLTLEDNTEVFYQMSEVFDSTSSRGVRWNDPAFGIIWPEKVEIIADRDRNYPDFK